MKRIINLGYSPLAVFLCGAMTISTARAQLAKMDGTELLTTTADITSDLVDGADRFLLQQLDQSIAERGRHWRRDFSSADAYHRSVEPNRQTWAHRLGLRDSRPPFERLDIGAQVGQGGACQVFHVRWPVVGDVTAEGLLLVPVAQGERTNVDVVAIPDADSSPEEIAGLVAGVPRARQFARRLAQSGCRVLVPTLVSRAMEQRRSPSGGWAAELTHREYLYRAAYELGRGLIGYETQKILAAVDWFERDSEGRSRIGVIGYGEGGMLALYAGSVDPRIQSVGVSGYFDSRQRLWEQPIDRNVFGLLEQFGDAELATLVAPRALTVETARGPVGDYPGKGGAPAVLTSPLRESVTAEVERARALTQGLGRDWLRQVDAPDSGSKTFVEVFLRALDPAVRYAEGTPLNLNPAEAIDPAARMKQTIHELDRHSQALLRESPYVRREFMKKLDTESVEKYETSVEWYREYFAEEVVGRFDLPLEPFRPRTRLAYDQDGWIGYEVVLDVFPDLIAYGILCLPKDMRPGERRPVVVCQHGLEGRPQDVVGGDKGAYHDFASRLAQRGFVTFAPQNLYIFRDRFRTLQRKAYLLKKTLFSLIVPQHQQIVNWLKTQEFVDPERIAFYGLSYGGKTAMRVPPLVTDYCLSICSADFNDWVWKNASTRSPYSYVWSGEYEIFEFDLGSTFNYAEMAALIAPRPFMVERGHFDGVAPDETVAYEFAKVRHLYQAKLGIGDRCEIEWFVGPHTINGKGTYDFLHRHLNWPNPDAAR